MRSVAIIAASILTAGIAGLVLTDDTWDPTQAADKTARDAGSSASIVLLDDRQEVSKRGTEFFLDSDVRVMDVRSIQATAQWKDTSLDDYDGLQLSVRTAASRVPIVIGILDPITPISMPVSHLQSDVEGMARSAWSFIVTPIGPEPVLFRHPVELQVTGTTGIPLGTDARPAASPTTLLHVEDVLEHRHQTIWNATGDAVIGHQAPAQMYWLDDGARVDVDRLLVTIELGTGYSLDGVRLGYQDANGFGWTWKYADARQADTLRFFIDVDADEQDAEIPTGIWRFGLQAGQSGGDLGLIHEQHGLARVPFTMTVTAA